MELRFFKYQGTGNDFIIIDNRDKMLAENLHDLYARLCDRHFGIGADGLMLLQEYPPYDFEMKYYNADGQESTMCGNGGRCLVDFAQAMGIIEDKARFAAIDGEHEADILDDGRVSLAMNDVEQVERNGHDWVLDTGSPHYVRFVDDVSSVQIDIEAPTIRNSHAYIKEGINVNFVQQKGKDTLMVRTYERGVEDETLSCGTGVVAAAIAYTLRNEKMTGAYTIPIDTPGGKLQVAFDKKDDTFTNVRLIGPATYVFNGVIDITNLDA